MKKLIAAVTVLAVSTAQADTIFVDASCPGGDGSELDPYCSIQTAIDNAVDTDEIVVAPGTYFEAINFDGKAVTLRSSDGQGVTTIDGTGNFHVVQCASGEGLDTVLDGFTVTGGNANGAFPDNVGGGMTIRSTSPTVTNCTFSGNSAGFGGGMFTNDSSATLANCTFSGNDATVNGGGMRNAAGGKPTLTDCTFSGNDATFVGGGISNFNNSSPTIMGCSFKGNTVGLNGGGISNFNNSSPTIVGCSFEGNTVGESGGGVHNENSCSPLVVDCVFIDNFADHVGGGFGTKQDCHPQLFNCLFVCNEALDGGGGFRSGNSGSSPIVVNCTFVGNSSPTIGGGYAAGSDGKGPIGYSTLVNCIFRGNTAAAGPQIALNGVNPADICVSYSNVEGGEPDIFVQNGFTLTWGPGNIDEDPLFVDPDGPDDDQSTCSDNDYRLSAGSPCIDAGNNTAVPVGITTDLDGNPRFLDDLGTIDTGNGDPPIVDMGAYEFQGTSCPWDCEPTPNGDVGINDFLAVLAQWGSPGSCDFDGGGVGINDFLDLLANWGPCP